MRSFTMHTPLGSRVPCSRSVSMRIVRAKLCVCASHPLWLVREPGLVLLLLPCSDPLPGLAGPHPVPRPWTCPAPVVSPPRSRGVPPGAPLFPNFLITRRVVEEAFRRP
jgi:hypothetical protein